MSTKIKSVQKVFVFTDENGTQVIVDDYRDGVPTIRISDKVDLNDLSKFIAYSFSSDSNFRDELVKAYGCKETIPLVAIEFCYLGEKVIFLKKYASKKKVLEELLELIQRNSYKEFLAKHEKMIAFELNANQGEMHFRNESLEEKWYELYEKIEDDDEEELILYAEGTCRNVEYLVEEQKKSLDEAFTEVYEALKGISEGDYEWVDSVINLAVQYWAGGDALEEWISKHILDNVKEELDDL